MHSRRQLRNPARIDTVLVVAGRGGCERIGDRLLADGYDVDAAETLGTARLKLAAGPDALVLAATDDPAFRLLRELRAGQIAGADPHIPVLAVGLVSTERLLLCHAAGADLQLESAEPQQVIVALRALAVRRGRPLQVGNLVVSREEQAAYADGALLPLTPIEFDLLVVLAENANRLVRFEAIAERVWSGYVASSTVGARICSLRRKLNAADAGVELKTRYGVGYHLVVTWGARRKIDRKETAIRPNAADLGDFAAARANRMKIAANAATQDANTPAAAKHSRRHAVG